MTKQNQILALEKGIKNQAETDFTKLYQLVQKADLFAGLMRTYQPLDDENGVQLPSEHKKVQYKATEVLAAAAVTLTRLFDITAVKDWTNQVIRADVTVDGVVLLSDVPVPYLLFLEKKLTDLATFVGRLPVVDPTENWHEDTNTGLLASEPVRTIRNVRIKEPLVLYPATDKHPAQVQVQERDIPEGTWTVTKLSGALRETQRAALLLRIRKLSDAVKVAREHANNAVVADVAVGKEVFEYLLGADTTS